MTKGSKVAAKPTTREEIVSPLKQKKKPDKKYHYVPGEEPETSSVSSYGRGRINNDPQVE